MFGLFKKKQTISKRRAIRVHESKRRPVETSKRKFDAGVTDRLTWSFTGSEVPVNHEIKIALRRMRGRSRELCMNNDYARRFIMMVKSNVIGPEGMKLQARAKQSDGLTLDKLDNRVIENAWRDFCKPFNFSIDRKLSFNDVENLAISSVARDGEIFIHLIDTPLEAYGVKVKIYPAEYVDENYNDTLPNGNVVIMGIEHTSAGALVAYHFRRHEPHAFVNVTPNRDYLRVPAEDIIHLFIVDYPEQVRGIPWTHTAIRRLNMIGKYEEAELVAAAIGASKMGFYTSPEGDGPTPDEIAGDGDEGDDAELIQKMEPGYIENLPDGVQFHGFDPTHPTTAFDGFMRAVLRGAASGLGLAYAGFSNDLENVNFSSIRSGTLEERDQWRMLQNWLKSHLHSRLYDRWLPMAILRGRLPLPMAKVDSKYKEIIFQARGWAWVDPKKDSDANAQNVRMGVETRQSILAQQGRDFDEVIEQLAVEKQRAEELGIDIDGALNQNPGEVESDDE